MKGLSLGSWKTRLALVGFLLMVPSPCTAQSAQAGRPPSEGIVLDQQALPIPGAQIVVTQQQGSLRKTAVSSTDRSGSTASCRQSTRSGLRRPDSL